LWNKYSHIFSLDGDVQELVEESGNVKGVSSVESGSEQGIEDVVGEVSLDRFSGCVMVAESSWDKLVVYRVFGIEEGSVEIHGEDRVSRNLWSSELTVVECDSSKVWNSNLGAVFGEVSIKGGLDFFLDESIDLFDDDWDQRALNEWNNDGSNIGNGTSAQFDVDIVWVDEDGALNNCEFWSFCGGWSSLLGGKSNFDINNDILDCNIGLTIEGDEFVD